MFLVVSRNEVSDFFRLVSMVSVLFLGSMILKMLFCVCMGSRLSKVLVLKFDVVFVWFSFFLDWLLFFFECFCFLFLGIMK